MRYIVEIEGKSYEVEIGPDGLTVDGKRVEADLQPNHDSHLWHLVLDGRSHTLTARRSASRGEWEIELGGRRHRVLALDERSKAIRELAGSTALDHGPVELKAPMPGLVIKVEVEPEAQVAKGQGVVVMEAMKMENELKATAAGRVREVRVAAGQAVDKGQVLLVIEPAE
ncbi:MAG TPA: biotin/lipoyl-containing protein [Gemmatimonadota bacterium]|nr:biotin/lipoyl-containing protein [Gemmatimonadota bacterium]